MADNKPASVPSWATDANFSSGPESGNPTKIEPSSGAKAQGEVPGQPYRGQRHNWLWNLLCSWAFYLSDLHNQVQFLNKAYTWTSFHVFTALLEVQNGFNASTGNVSITGTGLFRQSSRSVTKPILITTIGFDPEVGGGKMGVGSTGLRMWDAKVNGTLHVDVPIGAVVTTIVLGVKSSGNPSTALLKATLNTVSFDNLGTGPNTVTPVATKTATAGAYGLFTWSSVGVTNSSVQSLQITVEGGVDGTGLDPDLIMWGTVTYTTTHVDENN